MKYILIALLFCICYVGEAQNDIHYGVTDGTYRIKKDTTKPLNIKMNPRWRDGTLNEVKEFAVAGTNPVHYGEMDTIDLGGLWRKDTINGGWYKPFCHDVIKNDSVFNIVKDYGDNGWLSKGGYDTFLHKVDSIKSKWTDASKATRPIVFTITPMQDTIRCVLLCSDTSSQNGYRTQRCYWMYGHEVRNDWGILMIDKDGRAIDNTVYLDDKKVPLSKNLVVWLSKELK